MTRTRATVGVLGLVLVAVLAVVWVIPTVSGPSLECRDMDAEACDRAWRAAAAEVDGVELILPVTRSLVIGPEECPQVFLEWAWGVFGLQKSCN